MHVVVTDDKNNSYYFDVTYHETHTYSSAITQNPVQKGAYINDHVYQQPIMFTWDVGMSDCLGSIVNGQFNSYSSRSLSAFSILQGFWKNATLLTITTSFAQYKDMLIQSFIVTKDKNTMFGFKATVLFQQIIFTAATDISLNEKQSTAKSSETTKQDKVKVSPFDVNKISVEVGNNLFSKQVYSFSQYLNKYAGQQICSAKNNYTVTLSPIIKKDIADTSFFIINGKSRMSYADFVKKYGVP